MKKSVQQGLKTLLLLTGGVLPFHMVQAVQLSPNGLGEVLIYPYYNVHSDGAGQAYNSLLSLTNTSKYGKAVKIRIHEGLYGDEVASFNLLMSPYDIWTAALAPEGTGMKIVTSDTTCALPMIGTSGLTLSLPGENAERVQSGYIEVIEMGTIQVGSTTSKAVTHVQGINGVWAPPSCAKGFQGVAADLVALDARGNPLAGGLTGSMTLVNVQSGLSFNAKAVALGQFAKAGTVLGYRIPEDSKPDLTSAEPVSIVPGQGEETQLISQWEAGTADAVSAVLMHSSITNEYITEWSTASKTDWVMTFPTKPYYYEKAWTGSGDSLTRKVIRLFDRDMTPGKGGCDDISSAFYGREEERSASGGILMPQGASVVCGASGAFAVWGPDSPKVMVFPGYVQPLPNSAFHYYSYETMILGRSTNYPNGYAKVSWRKQLINSRTTVLSRDGSVLKNQMRTYTGLPIVGFAAHTYSNATIPLPDGKVGRSIYGVTVPHSYQSQTQ